MDVLAVFDDFRLGHYGDDPRKPNGWFGGYNFIPYPHGARIREGTSAMSSTGITNDNDYAYAPVDSGTVLAIRDTGATWFVPTGGGAPTAETALGAALGNQWAWCTYQDGSLFTNNGDATYKVDVFGVVELTGSPGGAQVAVLGDRVYVAGLQATPNRIRYSDAANENSWPAGNFIDLGTSAADAIWLMRRQRNSLVIATMGITGVTASSWYRLSGTPGTTLRVDPITPRGPIVGFVFGLQDPSGEGYGSRVWYSVVVDGTSSQVGYIDGDKPEVMVFRPTSPTTPSLASTPGYWGIAASQARQMMLMHTLDSSTPPLTRSALWLEGAWASLQFPFSGTFSYVNAAVMPSGGRFVLARDGNASNPPQFQQWGLEDDFEVAPDETDGSGAAVTGELHTPLTFDPENRDLMVQAVAVDFRHYSTTTAMSCTLDVHGRVDGTDGEVAVLSSTTQSYTVSGAPSSTGVRTRKTFWINDAGSGTGHQVRLTGCRGIAIERVTLLGTVAPSRV